LVLSRTKHGFRRVRNRYISHDFSLFGPIESKLPGYSI
jgi:hypothetical protein